MCGIFGYTGSKPPDMNVIKILGLYNESRGEHSCGLSVDGVITKGVGEQKHFSYLISDVYFDRPKNDFTVIGHTRNATGTAHTAENAHPFLIGEGEEREMVFTHNGIIPNIWDLANNYKENGVKWLFDKVDSKMLAEIIYYTNSFKVLEEYKGFAALAFYDRRKPNSLYLFKGASNNKDGKSETERPLFFMETKHGLYYSSMANPLFAVRENDKQKVFILEPNIVHYYEAGKLVNEYPVARPPDINEEKKVVVHGFGDRSEWTPPFQKRKQKENEKGKEAVIVAGGAGQQLYLVPLEKPTIDKSKKYIMSEVMFYPLENRWALKSDSKTEVICDMEDGFWYGETSVQPVEIINEKNPQKKKKGKIYYYSGRYHRNGHLVDGELWVDENGEFEHVVPKDARMIRKFAERYTKCFFTRGILFKNDRAYSEGMAIVKAGGPKWWKKANFAFQMSQFSAYPIKNEKDEAQKTSDKFRHEWYYNKNLPKSGTFVPFLSDYVLRVVDIGKIFPVALVKDTADSEEMKREGEITIAANPKRKVTDWPDFPANIMPEEVNESIKTAIIYMLCELVWKLEPFQVDDTEVDRMYEEMLGDWQREGVELGDMCKVWGIDSNAIDTYIKILRDIEDETYEQQMIALARSMRAENELEVDEDEEEPNDKALGDVEGEVDVEPANGSEVVLALPESTQSFNLDGEIPDIID